MIAHAAWALCLLTFPALVPTVAVVGLRPTALFLVPLAGSVLAALAAEFELAIGGSILPWFVVLAALANVVGVWQLWKIASRATIEVEPAPHPSVRAPLRRFGRVLRLTPSPWSWITILAVAGAVAWPLQALRTPMIFDDAYAIWTLHSIFIYGGHHAFLSGLKNPAYGFSNPDYPPLVPASGAMAFVSEGRIDIRLAVILTSVLNACGLGVIACGIVEAAKRKGQAVARGAAIAVAVGVCLVGFGLAGGYAIAGYADLLWAATATAAIVFGLLLPRSSRNLAVAWLCATVASLTKNEGLTTALMIFVLIALRYLVALRASSSSLIGFGGSGVDENYLKVRPLPSGWARRTMFAVTAVVIAIVMTAPGLAWAALVKIDGIGNAFLGRSPQTVEQRVRPTLAGLADNLHILPVAAVVAFVGLLILRSDRSRVGLGSSLWLWLVVLGSLTALALTYLFGAFEIHWWLSTSVQRTTIFANLALYTDLSIWLVVAASRGAPRHARHADAIPHNGDEIRASRHECGSI